MINRTKFIQLYARLLYKLDPLFFHPYLKKIWKTHLPFLKTSDNRDYVFSVYEVFLKRNNSDATYLMAISGCWGFRLFDILKSHKAKFAFVDIGANFGLYSLVAASNKNCKSIFAIEPNPIVFNQLKENISYNFTDEASKITPLNFAISDSNTSLPLNFNVNNLGKANLRGEVNRGSSINIECKNHLLLDNISSNINNLPLIIKIDVEGFEPVVISEIYKSNIKKNIVGLYIEVNPNWIDSCKLELMFNTIKKMGLSLAWRSVGEFQYDAYYVRDIPQQE